MFSTKSFLVTFVAVATATSALAVPLGEDMPVVRRTFDSRRRAIIPNPMPSCAGHKCTSPLYAAYNVFTKKCECR
ncbi:hypothetical protein C8J56DRAFT_1170879 [Mycena floridula]|nr:hypothetical protein C8J56DRAFT_1170879 [Mycena floridula]